MDKQLKRAGTIVDSITWFVLLCVVVIGVYIFDQSRPVVTGTNLEFIKHETEYSSLIGGTFEKARDCDFDGLKFYKGSRDDRAVTVEHQFLEKNKIREAGTHEFGDWRIYAVPAEMRSIYSNVWHQCYVGWRFQFGKTAEGKPKLWAIPFPWLTKSRFYR